MLKLNKISWLLIITIALLAGGCKKTSPGKPDAIPPGYAVHVVKIAPLQNKLYFASRIAPLTCMPLTSAVDGVITQKNFQYGKPVKSGDLLLVMQSMKEQSDYQAALTRYLQAKQEYDRSSQNYENDRVLLEKGIISKESYDSDRRSYFLNRLSLLQAEAGLKKFLKESKDAEALTKLSMSNIEKIDEALQLDKLTRETSVYAPTSGLAVFTSGGQESAKALNVGDTVKVGQMLLCVASGDAISLDISISEINIHQVFVGQEAIVTLEAVPSVTLHGFVETIEAQAQGGGQLPTFSARVTVHKLSPEILKLIKIGMSAKVAISVKHKSDILIPIVAATRSLTQTTVKIIDKDDAIKTIPIETGETTFDQVAVVSGLHEGDKVLVPN